MKLRYDGHGLNDETGARVMTFARKPESDGGGYILDADKRNDIAAGIVAALEAGAAVADLLAYAEDAASAADERPGCLKRVRALLAHWGVARA